MTGLVRGVLKKLNKTYGGSIIENKDMKAETREKFAVFCKNLKIPLNQQEKYKVFVPYNIQMP